MHSSDFKKLRRGIWGQPQSDLCFGTRDWWEHRAAGLMGSMTPHPAPTVRKLPQNVRESGLHLCAGLSFNHLRQVWLPADLQSRRPRAPPFKCRERDQGTTMRSNEKRRKETEARRKRLCVCHPACPPTQSQQVAAKGVPKSKPSP